MSSKVKPIKSVDDLVPDMKNANRHTQRGMSMMESSIRECGFGDSLTTDRNGNVISGNARTETLEDLKMLDPIVVQSDGTRPIIHQRVDLDIEDAKAKRLALYQNRVADVNLEWDPSAVTELEMELLNGIFEQDELAELQELAELEQDIESGLDEEPNTIDSKHKPGAAVKPVLTVDQLMVVERALKATGNRNRGEALTAVCQAFLNEQEPV